MYVYLLNMTNKLDIHTQTHTQTLWLGEFGLGSEVDKANLLNTHFRHKHPPSHTKRDSGLVKSEVESRL